MINELRVVIPNREVISSGHNCYHPAGTLASVEQNELTLSTVPGIAIGPKSNRQVLLFFDTLTT